MTLTNKAIHGLLEDRLSKLRNLAVGRIEEFDEHVAMATITDLSNNSVLTVHVDRDTGAVVGWQ
jgi:hypothetical protein